MFSSVIERLNDRRDGAGESGADAGFTLIELMVVLLIMAILLAIAIPTFLGVSGSANDRAAQSNLNTALTNVKSLYNGNGQTFGTATGAAATLVASVSTDEPSISWTTGSSTGEGDVSVDVTPDGNGVVLAVLAKSNTCWYAIDNEVAEPTTGANAPSWESATAPTNKSTVAISTFAAGTFYGSSNAGASSNTACTADSAANATSWNDVGTGQQGFQTPLT